MKQRKTELYIWDGINGDFEEIESLEAALEWIKEGCTDPDEGIHPDIESIFILKRVADVVVRPVEGKDTYRVELSPTPSSEGTIGDVEIEKGIAYHINERIKLVQELKRLEAGIKQIAFLKVNIAEAKTIAQKLLNTTQP